jgi:hypothetical protein
MLRTGHWFDGTPLRRDRRLMPGPDFEAAFARAVPWYRTALCDA